jgi:hypothetical protein
LHKNVQELFEMRVHEMVPDSERRSRGAEFNTRSGKLFIWERSLLKVRGTEPRARTRTATVRYWRLMFRQTDRTSTIQL